MHTFGSERGSVSEISTEIRCALIVHESIVFNTLELALSEKQVPRFVGNVGT
jgi:hypothetical protein